MSELIADTRDLSESWCPTCQPDRDPTREVLRVDYCGTHFPDRTGSEDKAALVTMESAGPAATPREGGDEGAAWCDLIHRRRAA